MNNAQNTNKNLTVQLNAPCYFSANVTSNI